MPADDSNKYDPIKHKYIFTQSNGILILALLMMCMTEAILILKLWIKPIHPVDPVFAFAAQFSFFFPAFAIISLRLRIGKKMKNEEISPSFARDLCLQLSVLLMLVYIAFMQFINIVPR